MPSPVELKAAGGYVYARNLALDGLSKLGGAVGRYVGDAPFVALRDGASKAATDENARTVGEVLDRINPKVKLALLAGAVALVIYLIYRVLR